MSSLKGEVEDYAITVNAGNRTIGNLVWIDADNDGVEDDMETGESGVPVQLWTPGVNGTEENGAGDDETAGSDLITNLNGNYVFSGLAAGAYYTRIPTPPSDFPLTSGVPDTADNQQDGDNNGRQPSGIGTAIRSPIITLTAAGEPAAGMDGDDTNGDLTIDFGLFTCPAITVRPIMPINDTVGAAYSQLISASGSPELED